MWKQLQFLAIALAIGWPQVLEGSTPLIELKVGSESQQGKLLGRTQSVCWLLGRDGRLHEISLDSVQAYRQVSASFSGFPPAQVRSRLLREFDNDFEVVGTRHYLVCASRGNAGKYSSLLEEVYRAVFLFFRTRGLKFEEPEFPLVVIVLPGRDAFEEHCRQDNVTDTRGLRGYYLRTSNRVVLFDTDTANQTASRSGAFNPGSALPSKTRVHISCALGMNSIDQNGKHIWPADRREPPALSYFSRSSNDAVSETRDTLIHEAIHQFAFNTGLHSRLGDNPKWLVEGLATVLEAPGVRKNASSRLVASRINSERLRWFRDYVAARRPDRSLASFVSGDQLFQSAALDAYSEAWALSFYLLETRPREYFQYLKNVANREPLRRYTASERLEEFQSAFGENIEFLETDFLRFIERLN